MGKYKTKVIQADLSTFRHNQVYPGIIPAYSKPCVTLTYLEPSYFQNPDILRTRSIVRTHGIYTTLVYSELCQTSTVKRFAIIVNGYTYFRKLQLFLQYKLMPRSLFMK